ncbi:MAG: Hsp20/alpha crystallin family protein [Ktedonobacteraceae bacterium]
MTSVMRYNPRNEFVSLRNAMDHLLEESLIPTRGNTGRQGIAATLYETGENLTLLFPLPGIKAEEVEIIVRQEQVQVKWTTHVPIPEGATVHWNGWQSGQFQQSLTLPSAINAEGVQAHYQDGVLTLQLPKAAHTRARTIHVSTAS